MNLDDFDPDPDRSTGEKRSNRSGDSRSVNRRRRRRDGEGNPLLGVIGQLVEAISNKTMGSAASSNSAGNGTQENTSARMDQYSLENCQAILESMQLPPQLYLDVVKYLIANPEWLRKNESNCDFREDYQHSGETIYRYVHVVCDAILELTSDYIKPLDFTDVPLEILTNPNFYPFFKDCLGAIDGTHIRGSTPVEEGSAHDVRILNSVLDDPDSGFSHPPPGKYYLVDAGYANRGGVLAPHRWVPYHVPDACHNLSGPMELFNYRHASLRNVVERTFGVFKKRFRILDGMNNYPLQKQANIVMACCVIHNFIKRFYMNDPIFQRFNGNRVCEEGNGMGSNQLTQRNTDDMGRVRDSITTAIWAKHESSSYC
ncbi:uncharacterized protein LOC116114087 [Pistacia vera]|uniref:uncharacterized protein LOC116114087 n=1 Tax=Pistacia vera TaxID=55513 RepID=UPI0012636E7C|nr:uncharacterized protein LOC116114087 [Pistacia vera]